jgi:hypothetical protein
LASRMAIFSPAGHARATPPRASPSAGRFPDLRSWRGLSSAPPRRRRQRRHASRPVSQLSRRATAKPLPGPRPGAVAAPTPSSADATSSRRARAPLRWTRAVAPRRPPAFQ